MIYFIASLSIITMLVVFLHVFIGIENKVLEKINIGLSFVILIIFFCGIQETTDKNGYRLLFENLKLAPDIGFKVISNITNILEKDYEFMILTYYVLMVIFMMKFLEKNSTFILFIVLNLQIFTMLFQANQIRYYLSFYLFLYSTALFFEKKIAKTILLLICAFIFHKSIILLYPFLVVKKYELKKYVKSLLVIAVGVYVSYDGIRLLVDKIPMFNHYQAYLADGFKISFLGWLYALLFYFIWLSFIIFLHKKVIKNIVPDDKYFEIFKLLLYPIVFILIGTKFLEINYRYILSFQVVNLIYITYILKYFNKRSQVIILTATVLLSLGNYFYFYELPSLIGMSSQKDDYILIYKTHKLINLE